MIYNDDDTQIVPVLTKHKIDDLWNIVFLDPYSIHIGVFHTIWSLEEILITLQIAYDPNECTRFSISTTKHLYDTSTILLEV